MKEPELKVPEGLWFMTVISAPVPGVASIWF
jgi:hypothetical protein